MNRPSYPTDLTDLQWNVIEPMIPPPKFGGRPRQTDTREVINAIFYLLRSGCAWRLLPHDFPPWGTVYTYFRQWKTDGTFKKIHDTLHQKLRKQDGRESEPSAAIIDSQSVKTTEKGGSKAMTPRNISRVVNGICWLTRGVLSLLWSSAEPMFKIEMEPSHSF